MRVLKGVEIPITICVSYTIFSLFDATLRLVTGTKENTANALLMFVLTSIAVLVLSIHRLFDEWNPIIMIVMQYVIAMGLVFLFVFLVSFIDPVSRGGYRDIFVSFTIPYVIGAGIYYVAVFQSAKRQDEILQEIKKAVKVSK